MSTIALVLLFLMGMPLLLLVTGGILLRTEVHRRASLRRGRRYPASRLLGDLAPFRRLLLEFVSNSPRCRELLERLAAANRPLTGRELLRHSRWLEETDEKAANMRFPDEGTVIALAVLMVTGLIRLGPGGISNTPAGYAVIASLKRAAAARTLPSAPSLQAERLTPPARPGRQPLSPRNPITEEADAPAMISAADYQELGAALAAARKLRARVGNLRALQEKLARATIIDRASVPPDLITMNSQAEVVDLTSGERLNLTLVYPVEADIRSGRLSVFSSLGAALLGRREGQLCEWPVPYGARRFRIETVRFQPETALAQVA